jgi:hypothetical protein
MLTTDTSIVGVDVQVNFDTNFLKVVDIVPQPDNSTLRTFAPLAANNNFDRSKVIQDATEIGLIRLAAYALDLSTDQTHPGFFGTLGETNPLAYLVFQTLTSGTTSLSFNFSLGSSHNSNVLTNQPTDVFNNVQNSTIFIGLTTSPSPTV